MMYIINTGFSYIVYKNGKPIPGTERPTWDEADEIRRELSKGKGCD